VYWGTGHVGSLDDETREDLLQWALPDQSMPDAALSANPTLYAHALLALLGSSPAYSLPTPGNARRQSGFYPAHSGHGFSPGDVVSSGDFCHGGFANGEDPGGLSGPGFSQGNQAFSGSYFGIGLPRPGCKRGWEGWTTLRWWQEDDQSRRLDANIAFLIGGMWPLVLSISDNYK
jgi:hypothetical protein